MDGFPSLFAIESSSAFGFSSAFSITSTERYDMCQHESFLRNLCNLPIFRDNVDASELLLRLVGLSHYLQGFTTIPGIPAGCLGFLPSTPSLVGFQWPGKGANFRRKLQRANSLWRDVGLPEAWKVAEPFSGWWGEWNLRYKCTSY